MAVFGRMILVKVGMERSMEGKGSSKRKMQSIIKVLKLKIMAILGMKIHKHIPVCWYL